MKRFISSDVSTDEALAAIDAEMPLAPLLWDRIKFTLDDWGRAELRPVKMKLALFPACQLVSADILEQAIDLYAKHGLLAKYEVEGKEYFAIHPKKWLEEQTYLRGTKRANHASSLPANPAWTEEECKETWLLMTMKGERGKVGKCQLTSADVDRQEAVSVPSLTHSSSYKSPLTPHEGGLTSDTAKPSPKKPRKRTTNGEYPPDFEAAWQEHPNKDAKRTGHKAWEKAKERGMPAAEMPEIIRTKRDCPKWRKDNGKFVPQFATWLNADGWLEVTEAKPDPTSRGRPLTTAELKPLDTRPSAQPQPRGPHA